MINEYIAIGIPLHPAPPPPEVTMGMANLYIERSILDVQAGLLSPTTAREVAANVKNLAAVELRGHSVRREFLLRCIDRGFAVELKGLIDSHLDRRRRQEKAKVDAMLPTKRTHEQEPCEMSSMHDVRKRLKYDQSP